ncbi:MAG: gephyrin-like molybdotransferase Glp [Oscillospiraceae bacterium]
MLRSPDYNKARELLFNATKVIDTRTIPIAECSEQILAVDLIAKEDVPPFARSAYDGYAFCAEDTINTDRKNPVTLQILEEVPAGSVPTKMVLPGTATKVLTGSPIPAGANAVTKYEATEFTDKTVTLFCSHKSGDNVVSAGEDVKKGVILAKRGQIIDPGVAGSLAAQGIAFPKVFRVPKIGVFSTGSELVEIGEEQKFGTIRDTNRYSIEAALKKAGFDTVYLGTAGDSIEEICRLIEDGLEKCDAVISTGGVSAGDYDLTPKAMEKAGAEMLFLGAKIKPGMACAYGVKDGKLVCGLSGNPASAITNFYVLALPALKKLAGYSRYIPEEIDIKVQDGFPKKSPVMRFLRGYMILSDGEVTMRIPKDQGNAVLSSVIGCNAVVMIPPGTERLEAGTILKGFVI